MVGDKTLGVVGRPNGGSEDQYPDSTASPVTLQSLLQAAQLRCSVLSLELAHLQRERAGLLTRVVPGMRARQELGQEAEHLTRHTQALTGQLQQQQALLTTIDTSASLRITVPLRTVATSVRHLLRQGPGTALTGAAPSPGQDVLAPPALLLDLSPVSTPPIPVARAVGLPRKAGRTILVAADFLPMHDQSAGGLRLRTLIQLMSGLGWIVQFGSAYPLENLPGALGTSEGRARYEGVLSQDGVQDFHYGLAAIDAYLQASGQDVAWAFLSFPAVASDLLPLVRCRCRYARVAYDMVDFHYIRLAREAVLRGEPALVRAAEAQRGLEACCAATSDVTVAVTRDEQDGMRALVPGAAVVVLPCAFKVPTGPIAPAAGRNGMLFVGGFWHQPNTDAVLWFVEHVWPLVRAGEPDASFRIVGANAGPEVLALDEIPGIELLGFVPDLTEVFARHRVFVAPLRFGAGMKGKVAQSMSYGLPVVGTPIAAEGMDLVPGRHLLVAEEPSAFADAVLQLLQDGALWSALSGAGQAHIQNNFSTEVVRGQLSALLDG